MPLTVLLTGFGPFPGAPVNPTGPLVDELARRRYHVSRGVRRVAHVFATRYEAVDRELPELIKREAPDILLMFGLAQRSHHLRVESRARNVISRIHADASGHKPELDVIVPGAPASLRLIAAPQRLIAAARAAGMPARLSQDAGRYLCNYLCWRACEQANTPGGPRLIAFIHVPRVQSARRARRWACNKEPFTFTELVQASEAIVWAALAALGARR
jgi:pyroglutamyl-peptidase